MSARSWYCLQAAAVVLGLLVALIYPWVALGLAIALFFGYVLGEWLAIRRSPRLNIEATCSRRSVTTASIT